MLQYLLDLPIPIHNEPKPKRVAAARTEGLMAGLIQSVASLMPASWNQIASWLKQIDTLWQAA